MNSVELLQNLCDFAELEYYSPDNEQNQKRISVTYELLKKWPRNLISFTKVRERIMKRNPWFHPGPLCNEASYMNKLKINCFLDFFSCV